jgi:hypothetical protein
MANLDMPAIGVLILLESKQSAYEGIGTGTVPYGTIPHDIRTAGQRWLMGKAPYSTVPYGTACIRNSSDNVVMQSYEPKRQP